MSSPHMYDPAYPAAAATDEALKGGGGGKLPKRAPNTLDLCEGSVPDLSDLNAPELSFDLQNYIGPDSGHPVVSLDDSSSLFTDILAEQHKPRYAPQYRYPMPQQGQIASDHYGTDAQGLVIKREPVDHIDLSSCSQRAGYTNGGSIYSYPPITDRQGGLGGYLPGLGRLPGGKPALPKASSSSSSSSSSSKHKKNVDKSSDEYRRRRERNNIAVRKSREKAKIRTRETERKVSELVRENDYLRKKVEMLTKELNVLKTVMSNVGVPPESVDSELVKSMHMDYGMHQEL